MIVPCSKKYGYMARPRTIIVISQHFKDLARQYHHYLIQLGYHSKSCQSRYNYLCEFLQWLEQHGEADVTKINKERVNQYYQYISNRPSKQDGTPLSLKTTHSHMKNVKDVFEMLLNQGVITTNPCSTLTFPYPKSSKQRTVLTQAEIQALYQAAQTAQERALLSLAYGCGLRVGELVKCNSTDVRLRDKILIVPKGKGNKKRVVPMSSGVIKDLTAYYHNDRPLLTMEQDYQPGQQAFMLHARGGRMQQWTYNKYLKRIINRTQNPTLKAKQITIHHLRHSIATHFIERGIPVEQIRQFLGHSQLETTQIYTHISQQQLKQLLE